MRAISYRPGLFVLLLMPLLATCTASPDAGNREGGALLVDEAQDEPLVALLIDGASPAGR
jgi:hypothetical protein